MSSFVSRFAVIIVPCALVACADRMRARQYSPQVHHQTSNTKNYISPESQTTTQVLVENPAPPAAQERLAKPAETYFEPPIKPISFRPGIQPHTGRQPLLWEKNKAESVMWSMFLMQTIGDRAAEALLPGAMDISEFCPKYNELDQRELKVNFWAYLVSAIAEVESGFDPANRMSEASLGTDKVTKKTVVSEGLLQLSYQDSRWYEACDFDWEADQHLNEKDLSKTILDPYRNLKCGVSILANQIKSTRRISIDDGYWSVLRPDGRKYSKVNQIKRRTRQLAFCS